MPRSSRTFLRGDAPNLLLPDPATGRPVQLGFRTETFDAEIGHSTFLGERHLLTYGGNVRQNNFDITIAPLAEDRLEAGAYLQDEIFLDPFRFVIGGRVDKFGNLATPTFSPRLAFIIKPSADQSLTLSYNRAFRAPSTINNFLEMSILNPVNLSSLAAFLPATLRPVIGPRLAQPFPLVVRAAGSDRPIGEMERLPLRQESLTAYEVSYTGTLWQGGTIGAAVLPEPAGRSHQLRTGAVGSRPLHGAEPPARLGRPTSARDQLPAPLAAQGAGPPVAADGAVRHLPAADRVHVLQPRAHPPGGRRAVVGPAPLALGLRLDQLLVAGGAGDPGVGQPLPPGGAQPAPDASRATRGISWNGPRYIASASVSAATDAFWSDVLTREYHGYSSGYTMVNGSIGMRWAGRRHHDGAQGDQPAEPPHQAAHLRRHPAADGAARGALPPVGGAPVLASRGGRLRP